MLDGTESNDLILAGGGNDAITGTFGNDKIDGQAGVDTLSYGAAYESFKIASGSLNTIAFTHPYFGEDTVESVERFKFTNKQFANDVNGAAGDAARVIITAFGETFISSILATGITLIDSGMSRDSLCKLIVDNKIIETVISDTTTQGYVDYVVENVIGRLPNPLESIMFVNMIDSGSMSRLKLLELGAAHSLVSDTLGSLQVELLGIPYDPGF